MINLIPVEIVLSGLVGVLWITEGGHKTTPFYNFTWGLLVNGACVAILATQPEVPWPWKVLIGTYVVAMLFHIKHFDGKEYNFKAHPGEVIGSVLITGGLLTLFFMGAPA